MMNPDLQEELANLILEYITSSVNPDYDENHHPFMKYNIVAEHVDFKDDWSPLDQGNAANWHDDDEMFLSWHRDYIEGLEVWLVNQGYGEDYVPLPAWNPECEMPTALHNAIIPEIYDTPLYVGLPLDDDFDMDFNSIDFIDQTIGEIYEVEDNITCGQFSNIDEFAGFIRSGSNPPADGAEYTNHNEVHQSIGGAMVFGPTASASAAFWLFHAHIDELYYCYQERCEDCAPAYIWPKAPYRKRGKICYDMANSQNVDSYQATITSDGVSVSMSIDGSGCIDLSRLDCNKTYKVVLIGSNDCGRSDDKEYSFRKTCFTTTPQFPSPGGIDRKEFVVTNEGPQQTISIANVSYSRGCHTMVYKDICVEENESFLVAVPVDAVNDGINTLKIYSEYGDFEYTYLVIR